MKEYIISLLLIGAVGSLVVLLAPEGEGGGLQKHLRFAVALVTAAVCLLPLTDLLKKFSNLDIEALLPDVSAEEGQYDEIFKESYSQAEVADLRRRIGGALSQRFGISENEAAVSVKLSTERQLEMIMLRLYGTAIWMDTKEIEKYLMTLYGCEVVIAIGD